MQLKIVLVTASSIHTV